MCDLTSVSLLFYLLFVSLCETVSLCDSRSSGLSLLNVGIIGMGHMPGSWFIYKMGPNLTDSLRGPNEVECDSKSL